MPLAKARASGARAKAQRDAWTAKHVGIGESVVITRKYVGA